MAICPASMSHAVAVALPIHRHSGSDLLSSHAQEMSDLTNLRQCNEPQWRLDRVDIVKITPHP